MKTLPVGSLVNFASLRNQDLIPAFLGLLRGLDAPEYEAMIGSPFGPIPSYVLDDSDSDWWYSDDANYLLDELFDILSGYAPDDHYFGAHCDDGSDFGVWEFER